MIMKEHPTGRDVQLEGVSAELLAELPAARRGTRARAVHLRQLPAKAESVEAAAPAAQIPARHGGERQIRAHACIRAAAIAGR
jgi:hypothetical protein